MGQIFTTVEMTILILLVIILAGPIIGAKLRVPGLLALIFLGMIFGPFGVEWLGRTDLVFDLGSIGILYLMFLAGVGFNLNAFHENRSSALGFGILSFVFPFALSVAAGLSYFESGILAAALLGSMWASNTLVAYPDVKDAGLEGTRAVRDAMSGGVVADLLSLLVLAVATSYAVIESVEPRSPGAQDAPTLPLFLSIPLLVGFTLWLLPRIGKWFFVKIGRTRVQRLLFALAGMAASAALAVVGGVAGIIGAFLAGIGLNPLVPKNSELMDRIDFVGSSVFVPAFLVSIGLRIDPSALVEWETILMGLVFVALVIVGKGLAVLVAARFFKYTFAEGGLILSLSIGQAASTLAVGQIGLELGLFNQRVVNASILTIVLAALLTSFGTQHFIRLTPPPVATRRAIGETVLLDARATGSDLELMTRFAGRIARADDGIAIPYVVADRERKEDARRRVAEAETVASEAGYDYEGVVRLSNSVSDGTLELIEEVEGTLAVIDWVGPRLGTDVLFGADIDSIGTESPTPTVAAHLVEPWNRVIVVPGSGHVAWHSQDTDLVLTVAERLHDGDEPLVVIANDESSIAKHHEMTLEYRFVDALLPGTALLQILRPDDLVVVPAYLIRDMPLPRRLRLSSRLARHNLAVVAGPGRLAVAPRSLPHAMERILGPVQ